MRRIDALLARFTPNALTAWLCAAILALGFVLSFFGLVTVPPAAILSTAAVLLGSCLLANWGISRLKKIPVTYASSIVTALILALILRPVSIPEDPLGLLFAGLCGAAGVALKHLLALGRRPAFNPAAAAALLCGLVFGSPAQWWVGNIALLPLAAAGGLLLSYRVRRLRLAGLFFAAFIAFMTVFGLAGGMSPGDIFQNAVSVFSRTPLAFFALFMLTDPKTAPFGFPLQAAFLVIVAFLYQPDLAAVTGFAFTPEQALLAGNLFAFITSGALRDKLGLGRQRAQAD